MKLEANIVTINNFFKGISQEEVVEMFKNMGIEFEEKQDISMRKMLNVERGGTEVLLTVFSTRKSFRAYQRKLEHKGLEELEATTELKKNAKGECLVHLVFHKEAMDAQTISREAVHAALCLLRVNKEKYYPFAIKSVDEEEELAHLVGDICNEVTAVYFDAEEE